jgi:hypothetical protein
MRSLGLTMSPMIAASPFQAGDRLVVLLVRTQRAMAADVKEESKRVGFRLITAEAVNEERAEEPGPRVRRAMAQALHDRAQRSCYFAEIPPSSLSSAPVMNRLSSAVSK